MSYCLKKKAENMLAEIITWVNQGYLQHAIYSCEAKLAVLETWIYFKRGDSTVRTSKNGTGCLGK